MCCGMKAQGKGVLGRRDGGRRFHGCWEQQVALGACVWGGRELPWVLYKDRTGDPQPAAMTPGWESRLFIPSETEPLHLTAGTFDAGPISAPPEEKPHLHLAASVTCVLHRFPLLQLSLLVSCVLLLCSLHLCLSWRQCLPLLFI